MRKNWEKRPPRLACCKNKVDFPFVDVTTGSENGGLVAAEILCSAR